MTTDNNGKSTANLLVLLVPLLVLLLRSLLDFNIQQWGKAIAFSVALGLIITALLVWRSKPLRRRKGTAILVALLLMFLSIGPVLQLNYLLDMQAPSYDCGEVMDLHISSGKTISYYVEVALPDGRQLELQTYPELYESFSIGDEAWIAIYHGGLGIEDVVLLE